MKTRPSNPDLLSEALAHFTRLAMFEDYELSSPESHGMDGDTPLHAAAYGGEYKWLKDLLPYVTDINVSGDIGNTPLHSAVAFGRVDMAELLLEHGADINSLNDYGDSPLGMMGRQPAFEGLLRAHGWRSDK